MRSALASLPIALALLLTTPSRAQSDAARAEALKRYNEGIALHDAGKEQDAYVKFAQAYAVLKTPPILFNLARTEQLTLRFVEAAAHFREYVALPEQPLVPKQTREKARAFLAEIHGQLGHLALTAPTGCTITIDGRELAQRAPFVDAIDVLAGSHVVVARLEEKSATKTVSAPAGVTTPVALQFDQPAPAPTSSAPAVAPTAAPPAALAKPERPPAVVEEHQTTRDIVRWTSAGVAVVGIGVGVGFMVAANGKDNDLSAYQLAHPNACADGSSAACADASSLQSDRDRDRTLSLIGFVAGGVGVAVAAATWIIWPNGGTGAQRGTWIVPSVGVAGYGLAAGGSF